MCHPSGRPGLDMYTLPYSHRPNADVFSYTTKPPMTNAPSSTDEALSPMIVLHNLSLICIMYSPLYSYKYHMLLFHIVHTILLHIERKICPRAISIFYD
jgi:hypothetical protein